MRYLRDNKSKYVFVAKRTCSPTVVRKPTDTRVVFIGRIVIILFLTLAVRETAIDTHVVDSLFLCECDLQCFRLKAPQVLIHMFEV